MRIVRGILIVLAILVALLFIAALFLPSSYRVERSIEIAATPGEVYAEVVDLRKWARWNPWTEREPTAKSTYSGADRGIGARWAWEGQEIGTGSLTIEDARENRSIRLRLVFTAPQSIEASDSWKFEPTSNGTRVTWSNEGRLDYPIGRFFGLVMDSVLGSDFEKGLANLKRVIEQ